MNSSVGTDSIDAIKEYLKIASNYSIPIFWGLKRGTTWRVESNGTAFVLDAGAKKFVVTAAHVYESYLDSKKAGSTDGSQLSNVDFEMEERLISYVGSRSMDIATFQISDSEISRLNRNVLRGSNSSWPPDSPELGHAIVVSGFPGAERKNKVEHAYSFRACCFNTPISSVSERHFGCSFDRSYWIDVFGRGFPPENYDLGGISGAPALALVQSEAGIVSWRLAGVVYEANASDLLGEILFVNHAKFISPNGEVMPSA